MKQTVLCCVLLLGLSTLLLTCAGGLEQPSLRCDAVDDKRLVTFPFTGTADTALAWIQDEYGLTAEDIKHDLSADRAQVLIKWKPLPNRENDALVWVDGRESASVSVTWQDQAPTLADALRCLGDPPLYRAYYAQYPEAIWTYLELWYPERGFMVTAHVPRKIVGFTNDQAIGNVSYVRPGPPEDLATRFFWAVDRGSEHYTQILRSTKLWPSDIRKITIDQRVEQWPIKVAP